MQEKIMREMLEVQDEQLMVWKKIHFWIKFWSILAIIVFILFIAIWVFLIVNGIQLSANPQFYIQ
ncbi:MAG: hypothetical protein IJ773_03120 [Lachnospiraceae bacterium]|nr:hypothetical protein [Lachnospiraceae bacterium]MBR4210532.1 hypothetical protein [Lachnospiraceae bacterium]